jgi:hypothetical protein
MGVGVLGGGAIDDEAGRVEFSIGRVDAGMVIRAGRGAIVLQAQAPLIHLIGAACLLLSDPDKRIQSFAQGSVGNSHAMGVVTRHPTGRGS